MSCRLLSIKVENFRSIRSLQADLSDLTIFVGKNDVGKSNVLRALNLFFNEETNPGFEFDFEGDYNFFAPLRKGKAKEISVTVEVGLPKSYHKTNGEIIVWKKRWREEGLWNGESDYFGQRLSRGKRGGVVKEKVDIPHKSNVHSLLRKIEFEYVPAVKDDAYFDDLRGRIYGIISEVAAQKFHESSTAFEDAIGDHLDNLTKDISASLGFDTRLALPRDLYHIFEKLDFLSGDHSVSLNNRGDGIKVRHIPFILKFMAEKKSELLTKGGAPVSSIWAYEEPENNLEISSAVQLADEFQKIASEEVAQILISTHSPAFYDLAVKQEEVALNFVKREADEAGTSCVKYRDVREVDDTLGTLAMLAPRISQLVDEVRKQEQSKSEAEHIARQNKATVFVEGESDKLVLLRALELFFPSALNAVNFETKRSGAGHTYVIDMLKGWRAQHKHHKDRPKAVGIVDGDAKRCSIEFNNTKGNTDSAKCYIYPKSEKIIPAWASRFEVPETLETLYSASIWKAALDSGRLKQRDRVSVLSERLKKEILNGEVTAEECLDDSCRVFVEMDFNSDYKIKVAQEISESSDIDARNALEEFEPLLRLVLSYLGIQD